MSARSAVFLQGLAALIALSASAQAETVRLTVTEVLAQNRETVTDPDLDRDLFKRLRRALNYKGYSLLWKHELLLVLGEPKFLLLSGGHSLQVKAFRAKEKLKLDISIYLEKKKVFGPITIVPKKSPTVIGPRKLKQGDMLLHISLKKEAEE